MMIDAIDLDLYLAVAPDSHEDLKVPGGTANGGSEGMLSFRSWLYLIGRPAGERWPISAGKFLLGVLRMWASSSLRGGVLTYWPQLTSVRDHVGEQIEVIATEMNHRIPEMNLDHHALTLFALISPYRIGGKESAAVRMHGFQVAGHPDVVMNIKHDGSMPLLSADAAKLIAAGRSSQAKAEC